MLTGQCLCGDIKLEYDGPLGPIALCHCIHARFTAGEDLIREYESRPGKYRGFCPRCGSQLYSRVDAIPGILRLRVGVINEPLEKRPASHVYVGSKSDWFTITDDTPQFEKTERTNDPH
jgi:hypothetical protein